jgi:hypothetical protein
MMAQEVIIIIIKIKNIIITIKGPPDANTFFTDANANQNPRADRHNMVLTKHMGNNVPTDYLGYVYNNPNLTYGIFFFLIFLLLLTIIIIFIQQ